MTVGALGASSGMEAGTIRTLVKQLEAADMLSRERDRADERRVLVTRARGVGAVGDVDVVMWPSALVPTATRESTRATQRRERVLGASCCVLLLAGVVFAEIGHQ